MKSTVIAALSAALSYSSPAAALPPAGLVERRMMPSTRAEPESTHGGAIYSVASGSDDTITSVSAAFRIPDPFMPTMGPTANDTQAMYAFSIWVGIGGWQGYGSPSACPATSARIRAGVDLYWDGFMGSSLMPFAWYQFGTPEDKQAFAYAGFNVAAGDYVRITVKAQGNDVTALMENFGAGVTSTAGKTPLQSAPPTYGLSEGLANTLCRSEAAWMLEDMLTETEPPEPVKLANFTDVTLGELSLTTSSGASGSATTAKVVNINLPAQGGQLTDCKAVDATQLRCHRTVGVSQP